MVAKLGPLLLVACARTCAGVRLVLIVAQPACPLRTPSKAHLCDLAHHPSSLHRQVVVQPVFDPRTPFQVNAQPARTLKPSRLRPSVLVAFHLGVVSLAGIEVHRSKNLELASRNIQPCPVRATKNILLIERSPRLAPHCAGRSLQICFFVWLFVQRHHFRPISPT